MAIPLWAAALAATALSACEPERSNEEPEAPPPATLVGRWRYSSEDIDSECDGPELERDAEPRRPVEFVRADGAVRLEYETCKVPLVVEGPKASSDASTECPWVDGVTVTVRSVRAELQSGDRLRLVTETHIVGEHPQAPGKRFDCRVTSTGTLTRAASPSSRP